MVKTNQLKDDVNYQNYAKNDEIGKIPSDIVFLDQDAVKGLFNNYPPNCGYVLVNCLTVRYIPWIVVGPLRRIILRKVRFLGIKSYRRTEEAHSGLF